MSGVPNGHFWTPCQNGTALDPAINLTVPFLSITSNFCVELLNSMLLALVT
jgi:hypothetical protein